MAKNKSSLEKDKKKKVPFNVLSKKGLMGLALAGVMMVSPLMLAGCSNGQDGKDGANGPQWYYNTVDVVDGALSGNVDFTAVNGDFYIDTDSHILYQLKNNSWTVVMENYGRPGNNGTDGISPTVTINTNGNWEINGVDSGVKAEGQAGTNGTNGTDGTTPTISINDDGYWVINNQVTDVKAEAIDGTNGKDGSTWFSDSGVPSADLGNIGDFYMDKENYNIYEKQSNGWTFVANIKEKEPDMLYYADITNAMNAINNKTYDDMSLRVNEEQANIGVTLINDTPKITLLNDLTLTNTISITNDMILDLQGNVLTFSTNVGIEILSGNLKIDGSDANSKIYISNTDESTTAIKVVSGECSIIGGLYQSHSTAIGTQENAEIITQDETTGTINAILINRGGEANITNCDITAISPNALDVCGILNNGVSVVCKSDIVAKSNYTANAEGTDYGSLSRGVVNNAVLTLKDCNVAGTHSGMKNTGVVYIDGGVYEGYGHGGIYFCGNNKTSYVKNATIKQCAMFEGFYDDGVAGTNQAGMYVGGADNMKIYMDNCEFSGVYYPFVMKKNCSGNALYVSNSNINLDCEKYIRLDVEDNKLFIGIGNNFNISEHTAIEVAATSTDEDYLFYFPIY